MFLIETECKPPYGSFSIKNIFYDKMNLKGEIHFTNDEWKHTLLDWIASVCSNIFPEN